MNVGEFTGNDVLRVVTYILKGPCYGLEEGYVIIAIKSVGVNNYLFKYIEPTLFDSSKEYVLGDVVEYNGRYLELRHSGFEDMNTGKYFDLHFANDYMLELKSTQSNEPESK